MTIRDYRNDHIDQLIINTPNIFNATPFPYLPLIPHPSLTHLGRNYGTYLLVTEQQGAIQYAEIPTAGTKALSYMFSGCAMAYFNHNGHYYVAHIFLDLRRPDDCGNSWNQFVINEQNNIHEYVIFRPYGANRIPNYITRVSRRRQLRDSVVGIILPDLRCYSVVTDWHYSAVKVFERTRHKYFSNDLSREANVLPFLIPTMNRRNW